MVLSSPVTSERQAERAKRRADQALVVTYHEVQLAGLLEHVRDGFARYDAGELDAFELDDLIHRYKKSARELWKFCAVSGSRASTVARTLELLAAEDDLPDWWEAGAPQRG
jgi:hypothetical protein